jgi:hypothetical protein
MEPINESKLKEVELKITTEGFVLCYYEEDGDRHYNQVILIDGMGYFKDGVINITAKNKFYRFNTIQDEIIRPNSMILNKM